MTTTRSLSRADRQIGPNLGRSFVPQGPTKEAAEQRQALGAFLDEHLACPQGLTADESDARVQRALDTMTLAERVYCEIDMLREARVMHSYDYDPFAGGR